MFLEILRSDQSTLIIAMDEISTIESSVNPFIELSNRYIVITLKNGRVIRDIDNVGNIMSQVKKSIRDNKSTGSMA